MQNDNDQFSEALLITIYRADFNRKKKVVFVIENHTLRITCESCEIYT